MSRSKISYEFILKNTDIKNNLINIYTTNIGVLSDNDIILLMKIELENILANIKLYHKLFVPDKRVFSFDLGISDMITNASNKEFDRTTVLAIMGIAFLKFF